jgi:hypothetical protein
MDLTRLGLVMRLPRARATSVPNYSLRVLTPFLHSPEVVILFVFLIVVRPDQSRRYHRHGKMKKLNWL